MCFKLKSPFTQALNWIIVTIHSPRKKSYQRQLACRMSAVLSGLLRSQAGRKLRAMQNCRSWASLALTSKALHFCLGFGNPHPAGQPVSYLALVPCSWRGVLKVLFMYQGNCWLLFIGFLGFLIINDFLTMLALRSKSRPPS